MLLRSCGCACTNSSIDGSIDCFSKNLGEKMIVVRDDASCEVILHLIEQFDDLRRRLCLLQGNDARWRLLLVGRMERYRRKLIVLVRCDDLERTKEFRGSQLKDFVRFEHGLNRNEDGCRFDRPITLWDGVALRHRQQLLWKSGSMTQEGEAV